MIVDILYRQFQLTHFQEKLPKETVKAIINTIRYQTGIKIEEHIVKLLWKNYYNTIRGQL